MNYAFTRVLWSGLLDRAEYCIQNIWHNELVSLPWQGRGWAILAAQHIVWKPESGKTVHVTTRFALLSGKAMGCGLCSWPITGTAVVWSMQFPCAPVTFPGQVS